MIAIIKQESGLTSGQPAFLFLQNELFLLKDFLACHNVGNQACNHQCNRTEVYNVHIVPTQEVAEDDEDCANDENCNSCDF